MRKILSQTLFMGLIAAATPAYAIDNAVVTRIDAGHVENGRTPIRSACSSPPARRPM